MKQVPPHPPLAEQLSALGEPVRLRVLRLAEREELSVGEIAKVVQLPQSTVSRHLKLLLESGWLTRRNEGTATFYRLILDDLPPAAATVWVAVREQFGRDRVASEAAEDERRLTSVLAERREDSQAFFGRVAGQWDEVRADLFGSRFTPIALLGLIPAEAVIADLGCGTGNVAELLAPFVRRVIAVDQSGPMLKAAQMRLKDRKNVDFRAAQLEELPIGDGEVDAAVAMLVFHHLPDPAAACREMRRILRPGGTALIVDMVDHDRATYRHTMGHRWQGFSAESILGHMTGAGLVGVRYLSMASDTQARGPGLFVATGTAPPGTADYRPGAGNK